MPTQQEAVRGEMEHTKLNQAFIFCLVKLNATLFSDFHKKTSSDLRGRWGTFREVTNKPVLLTRGGVMADRHTVLPAFSPRGEQTLQEG